MTAEITSESGLDTPPALKRRKVRKGTQSCWECKRRKIRCSFSFSSVPPCDGCKVRELECIGQEFYEDRKLANVELSGTPDILPKQTDINSQSKVHSEQRTELRNLMNDVNTSHKRRVPPTAWSDSTTHIQLYQGSTPLSKCRHDGLCYSLRALWPSQKDLEIITSASVGISTLSHGTVCMPYSTYLRRTIPTPQELLQLPPISSHPVLVCRKLLLLASFLQGISPQVAANFQGLSVNCHDAMSRIVEVATKLVTQDDDLVASLEGIECIMMASMYHNNAGDLRRAWLINRRAMTVAQTMKLHQDEPPPATMLDLDTRDRISPKYMWFRLVLSDRYLSLMLGLPAGSQEDRLATSEALASCEPVERLERIEAFAAGQILRRDKTDLHNPESVYEIDRQLQDAAAAMPAEWWLVPDIPRIAGSDADAFRQMIRLTNQFAHYHVLAQLHLPYMLRSSTDRRYEYNRNTAVNASREILLRFVKFRGPNQISAYCRGIDFLAFIASTVLCIAHIDSRKQYQIDKLNSATAFDFLAHQRPSDRGLMERTLQIMETMSYHKDAIAGRIASLLQHLLGIEAAATQGRCYETICSPQLEKQDLLCSDDESSDGNALSIGIPTFGRIKFEYNEFLAITRSESRCIAEDEALFDTGGTALRDQNLLTSDEYNDPEGFVLQGVDMALFNNLFEGQEFWS